MEFLPTIILPLSLLLLFLIHQFRKLKPSNKQNPPGPPRLPFIGNLHQLDVSCLHEYLWQLSRQYGDLMLLKFGSIPTLVVSSARLAEEVLKNQDSIFCSRPKMLGQQRLSYNNSDIVFAAYSQEWRERRKISVLHLLTAKRSHQFRPIREDEVSRMLGKIRKDAELGVDTNLSETLVSIASSNICRIAFGKRLDDEVKFLDLLKEIQAMFVGFFFTDYFPSIGWLDYVTGMRSQLEKTFRKTDSFYQQLIDEHLDPNRSDSMNDDLIDIMLQLQRDKSTSFDITVDHIKAMLLDVFVAGTETSVTTVVWAMTALIKNPTAMKTLQAEIRGVMGKKQILDEDDIEKLPYLTATIKETFRFYPTVPLLVPRMTMEKCNLDGYEIQANTMVYVNTWAIGRDPKVWENADEFLPDRFLNCNIDLKGQDFQLTPFGSGRRGCPGYQMGLVAVHLLLANLLYSFDWELPLGMKIEDLDTESSPGLAMNKKNALTLVAKNCYQLI